MAMLPSRARSSPDLNADRSEVVEAIMQAQQELGYDNQENLPHLHSSRSQPGIPTVSASEVIRKATAAVLELQQKADGKPVLCVETIAFNTIIVLAVVVNLIVIGIEVDHDMGAFGEVINHLLTGIWVLEASLKIFSLGVRAYFKDAWNRIDFLLALVAVFDTWVILLFFKRVESDVSAMTAMRVLRIARTARLIRTLRLFKQLFLLLNGMVQACITLVWVFLLMLLAIYVAGIIITYIFGHECDDLDANGRWKADVTCRDMYGTLMGSMITLFQVACLDMEVVRPVAWVSEVGFGFLVLFIIFSSFGLVNIIMGVMVESVLLSSKQNEDRLAKAEDDRRLFELQVLSDLFQHADADGSGAVSKEEFLEVCQQTHVQKLFEDLRMPVSRKNLAMRLYEVLDVDRQGALDSQTFQARATALKKEGKSLLQDQTMLLMEVRHINRRVERVETSLDQLHSKSDEVFSFVQQLARRSRQEEIQITAGNREEITNGHSLKSLADDAAEFHSPEVVTREETAKDLLWPSNGEMQLGPQGPGLCSFPGQSSYHQTCTCFPTAAAGQVSRKNMATDHTCSI
eukprot:TRINITY_DN28343_c0_g1_i1.p1 TRINITY_DN28343_c0_g1~~TRINITY_DN28343_c0_g1_i1.p1  ORF type:complete len:573 (+),score=89.99 TRINITY_DN28343_c0_g1_i1:127-1845(+)